MKYGKPVGCTYESPRSGFAFLVRMSEVHAALVFIATVALSVYLYKTSGLSVALGIVIPVGAGLTRYLGVGHTSASYVLNPRHDNMFAAAGRPVRAIVTGATSGIGLETVKEFIRRGMHVTLAVRNADKARSTVAALAIELALSSKEVAALVDIADLDVTKLASVRRFAQDYLARGCPLDVLVCNAGAMLSRPALVADAAPDRPVDVAFATNALGHFLLVSLLFPLILRSATRVVTLSSAIHLSAKPGPAGETFNVTDARRWDPPAAYATGKLASLWLARAVQFRIDRALARNSALGAPGGARAAAMSVHPGTVWTPFHMPFYHDSPCGVYLIVPLLFGPLAYCAFKSAEEGARTTLHCALAALPAAAPAARDAHSAAVAALGPAAAAQPGQLHMDARVCAMSAAAGDDEAAERFWAHCLWLLEHMGLNSKDCAHWDLIK